MLQSLALFVGDTVFMHRFLFANVDLFFPPVSLASSSGNWQSHMSPGGMLEYDMPMHAPQMYSHSAVPYSHSTHNR